MSGYAFAQLDDVDEISDGRIPMRPLRRHFGITSFGVNAWTAAAAGDRIINEHDEADDMEELYVVYRGAATFELDGERVEAPAGTLVFARPGVTRTAWARQAGTTIIVLGGTPGEPYEGLDWERWAPVAPLYEAGDYAEAAERTRRLVEAHPDTPMLLYLLACCESKAGRTDEALEHLRAAAAGSRRLRVIAAKDPELDAIRGDPAFAEAIGP